MIARDALQKDAIICPSEANVARRSRSLTSTSLSGYEKSARTMPARAPRRFLQRISRIFNFKAPAF